MATPTRGPWREGPARPELPEDVTGAELDREVRGELSSLSAFAAKDVARHLVMTGRLLDEDPELAWQHAMAARSRAARIAVVREAAGLACYRTQRYAEALAELRTARRLTGSNEHLPIMADCERGLGRPERALAMATSAEASTLDAAGRIEMRIVAAGARDDMGQRDAAVVTLQIPELQSKGREPWLARLRSAYADALAGVGRDDDAKHWLELAAQVDETGETGAAERLAMLDGLVLLDMEEDDDDDDTLDDTLDDATDDLGTDESSAETDLAAGADDVIAGDTQDGEQERS